MGRVCDCRADRPSPPMPPMILLLDAAGPSRWESKRWDRGAGCGCWAACLVALALLFAVTVFAL